LPNNRHITLPAGFVAGAARGGIKRRQVEDVAIIAAAAAVPAAMLTTTNQVVGAPVRWNRRVLPKGYGQIRAIAVNAGCANTCNGPRGDRDAATMARLTAQGVGCKANEVLICSTGVIGQPMPMDKLRAGIAGAAAALGTHGDDGVTRAIMTTDTRPKTAVVQAKIGGQRVTVAGVAKGSGMIAPSMATMLVFVTTDAAVAAPVLHKALRAAAEPTFNAITVDGDTSTSDTLIVLASGAAANRPVSGGPDADRLRGGIQEVCGALAEAIVRDGEGATKLIRVTVCGAVSDREARLAARTIAESPLFKCAVHGGDPNWGRILAAAGRSQARVDQDRASCKLGGITVMRRGTSCPFDLKAVQAHMATDEVLVELDLRLGKGRYTVLTCDLSREYIAINADYHT
jgi:glutamate N-acetyltransferase / amino-acid N-acetyltransferase